MMPTQSPPDGADDPLLPFVLAARAGDQGAERELLLRVAPVVLEVLRAAPKLPAPELTELALDVLLRTLRALPSLRGDEPVWKTVATIAREQLEARQKNLNASEREILDAASRRMALGARPEDRKRIRFLVEDVLADDAAVLISHFAPRPEPRRRLGWALALLCIVLVLAGVAIGLWARRLVAR